MSNDIKLKPCPFCGQIPVLRGEAVEPISVYCYHCDYDVGYFDNVEEAAEAWNKRYEQFSLSEMELLKDLVKAKLDSIKQDSDYKYSLLRLAVKCIDIIHDLKEYD